MCQKFILSYCQVLFHYVEKTEFGCPFTVFFLHYLFMRERESKPGRSGVGGDRGAGRGAEGEGGRVLSGLPAKRETQPGVRFHNPETVT